VGSRLSGDSTGGDFCGSANIAGKPQSSAETELAAVYKLMLRGQCFSSSPKARKGTPKPLASHHIFDQSIPSSALAIHQSKTDKPRDSTFSQFRRGSGLHEQSALTTNYILVTGLDSS